MSKGFEGLEAQQILEKNENSISLLFTIAESSPYFDGHFPGFPILPAVAQLDIVINFARCYFNTASALSKIKKIKFVKTINPSVTLLLKIELKENVITFKIAAPDESEMYSGGTIILTSPMESV